MYRCRDGAQRTTKATCVNKCEEVTLELGIGGAEEVSGATTPEHIEHGEKGKIVRKVEHRQQGGEEGCGEEFTIWEPLSESSCGGGGKN